MQRTKLWSLSLMWCIIVRTSTQCLSRYTTRPIDGFSCKSSVYKNLSDVHFYQCAHACIRHKVCWSLSYIITWLRCFFPGFDRFIPGFDRFIPDFDRFIPASIPVTGTLPPTIKNISSKKMYFLNLISSFFISLIWNNTIKKYSAMPRMHIFLKNTVNTNPKLFRAQFNATGCRLWITACDRSLQNVVNVTQKTLF